MLEKTTTILYFDSNVNRDGMKERKVAMTIVRIKFYLAQSTKTIAEFFIFVDFHMYHTEPDSPMGAYRR